MSNIIQNSGLGAKYESPDIFELNKIKIPFIPFNIDCDSTTNNCNGGNCVEGCGGNGGN